MLCQFGVDGAVAQNDCNTSASKRALEKDGMTLYRGDIASHGSWDVHVIITVRMGARSANLTIAHNGDSAVH